MLKLYIDAATNGQPGKAGVGILVVGEQLHRQISIPLEAEMTIQEAEWQALLLGLEYLINQQLTQKIVLCYTDSQFVAQSVEVDYIKNKHLRPYLYRYRSLQGHFSFISVQWIDRGKNKGADHLAKQALQKAIRQN